MCWDERRELRLDPEKNVLKTNGRGPGKTEAPGKVSPEGNNITVTEHEEGRISNGE